ncbi:DoxX family protein [Silvimonas sp.]|uniref:DoxX family protein n=1 Tax=Silvimonas sp. TaxID=2650811 RepID=UPI0028401406|nr:DoxX family protein [Silvimonas sp.]MDR3428935.1 DoxX family protein [Silvimonas sp.]
MNSSRTAPFGIFILRLALGVMFVAHGATKLFVFTLPGTAHFFASLGLPGWLAYPITFAELAGGIALILGIFPRWVAAVLALELFGAATVHFGNGWMFTNANGGWEYPVFLAVTSAAVALLGDGAFVLKRSTFGRN